MRAEIRERVSEPNEEGDFVRKADVKWKMVVVTWFVSRRGGKENERRRGPFGDGGWSQS